MKHQLDTYKEGWYRVEFCTKCGAEGLALLEDCQPPVKDENQFELFSCWTGKKIDRQQEQS